MPFLREAIHQIGGPQQAARICDVSPRAIYKWLVNESLPRTEYTGETDYAEKLSSAKGAKFTAKQLRDRCRPESKTA